MMDISRMLGIGIVMIIPGFVGSGLLWNIFGSWLAVLLWVAVTAAIYGGILFKVSSSYGDDAH
ncbi:MAG: hypothetical protein JW932_04920 [Deltaproteobacteria bacterium]|nr:hypothetical protein [Deltaproteobacteria bacterium]